MEPIIYLHDIRDEVTGLVGANLGNADLYGDVVSYLEANPGTVVSADDGYRSVLRLVPLIERTQNRLIVFLTTGFLDRSVFPYEVALSSMLEGRQAFRVFGSSLEPGEAFRTAHDRLKKLGFKGRKSTLQRIAAENGLQAEDFRDDRFLTWGEAAALARHPQVEIGAHTRRHLHLPSVGIAVAFRELLWPRHELASRLGVPIRALAYPYGGNNAVVRHLARFAGYTRAYGTAARACGPMALPRKPLRATP